MPLISALRAWSPENQHARAVVSSSGSPPGTQDFPGRCREAPGRASSINGIAAGLPAPGTVPGRGSHYASSGGCPVRGIDDGGPGLRRQPAEFAPGRARSGSHGRNGPSLTGLRRQRSSCPMARPGPDRRRQTRPCPRGRPAPARLPSAAASEVLVLAATGSVGRTGVQVAGISVPASVIGARIEQPGRASPRSIRLGADETVLASTAPGRWPTSGSARAARAWPGDRLRRPEVQPTPGRCSPSPHPHHRQPAADLDRGSRSVHWPHRGGTDRGLRCSRHLQIVGSGQGSDAGQRHRSAEAPAA